MVHQKVWIMGYGRVWSVWQGTDSVAMRKYGLWEVMGYHRYGLRQRRLYMQGDIDEIVDLDALEAFRALEAAELAAQ